MFAVVVLPPSPKTHVLPAKLGAAGGGLKAKLGRATYTFRVTLLEELFGQIDERDEVVIHV
jgi:hypothetical protein